MQNKNPNREKNIKFSTNKLYSFFTHSLFYNKQNDARIKIGIMKEWKGKKKKKKLSKLFQLVLLVQEEKEVEKEGEIRKYWSSVWCWRRPTLESNVLWQNEHIEGAMPTMWTERAWNSGKWEVVSGTVFDGWIGRHKVAWGWWCSEQKKKQQQLQRRRRRWRWNEQPKDKKCWITINLYVYVQSTRSMSPMSVVHFQRAHLHCNTSAQYVRTYQLPFTTLSNKIN